MDGADGLAVALLERYAVAAMVVGADGAVLLANSRARSMLELRDVLFTDAERRLQLYCAQTQPRLAAALASTVPAEVEREQCFLVGSRRSPVHYLISVAALADDCMRPPQHLVTAVAMNEAPSLDTSLLQSLYGLSPAEAKVAACLGSGQDVTSSARQLGVQPATARAQLKAVFRKLAINRQQDLVRITTLVRLYCGKH